MENYTPLTEDEQNRIMQEFYDSETERYRLIKESDDKIMSQLKEELPDEVYSTLEKIVTDIDGFVGGMSIVSEPQGEYQNEFNEEYGDTCMWSFFKGQWVNQHSLYPCEDCYVGEIYIKIAENKFLSLPYQC